MTAWIRAAALVAVLPVLGACASVPAAEMEEGSVASVVAVEHNRVGMPAVSIHLHEEVGAARFLGSIGTGETDVFEIAVPPPGMHRLVAEAADGRRIISRPFMFTGAGVRWNLQTNVVRPLPTAEG